MVVRKVDGGCNGEQRAKTLDPRGQKTQTEKEGRGKIRCRQAINCKGLDQWRWRARPRSSRKSGRGRPSADLAKPNRSSSANSGGRRGSARRLPTIREPGSTTGDQCRCPGPLKAAALPILTPVYRRHSHRRWRRSAVGVSSPAAQSTARMAAWGAGSSASSVTSSARSAQRKRRALRALSGISS